MSAQAPVKWDTDRVLTIPNVVSFLRLLSVVVFGVLILLERDTAAVILLVVFGATDWLDGFLARRMKQTSALGAKLDPAADRLYIVVAIITFAIRGIVPWWFFAIVFLRDVMLAALVPYIKKTGTVALPVNFVGKAGTAALLMAFPVLLLGASDEFALDWMTPVGWGLAILGAALYWWAGVLYVLAARALVARHRGEIERT